MANTEADEGELEATFVFKGTVRKLKAATTRSAPIDERTAVTPCSGNQFANLRSVSLKPTL